MIDKIRNITKEDVGGYLISFLIVGAVAMVILNTYSYSHGEFLKKCEEQNRTGKVTIEHDVWWLPDNMDNWNDDTWSCEMSDEEYDNLYLEKETIDGSRFWD